MSPVLDSLRERFTAYRTTAERALAQVDDGAFFAPLPGLDPLAVLVKHLAGNYRSRWTDFLTADGNKPWRDRDGEFEIRDGDTRQALMAAWEEGWRLLDEALAPLADADLTREATIRGERHTVIAALHRALAHTAYHVGQIVLLAKHAAGEGWQTLSIPRGGSAAYEVRVRAAAAASGEANAQGLPPEASGATASSGRRPRRGSGP